MYEQHPRSTVRTGTYYKRLRPNGELSIWRSTGTYIGPFPLVPVKNHLDVLRTTWIHSQWHLIIMATGGYVKKVRWAYLLY